MMIALEAQIADLLPCNGMLRNGTELGDGGLSRLTLQEVECSGTAAAITLVVIDKTSRRDPRLWKGINHTGCLTLCLPCPL
jgi:hypothetical protein